MRKLYVFMMISADGYFEAPGHNLDWHNVDAEFEDFAIKQLDESGELVFGRRTYDLMADFWPSDHAWRTDEPTARRMCSAPKLVFSRQPLSDLWENTTAHTGQVAEVIRELKSQPGKPIAVLGSSNLCLTLLREGLLDELRLMVNPVLVGAGTPLFHGLDARFQLELTESRRFGNGNVLQTYAVNYEQ